MTTFFIAFNESYLSKQSVRKPSVSDWIRIRTGSGSIGSEDPESDPDPGRSPKREDEKVFMFEELCRGLEARG
jgi:hypothetical protein